MNPVLTEPRRTRQSLYVQQYAAIIKSISPVKTNFALHFLGDPILFYFKPLCTTMLCLGLKKAAGAIFLLGSILGTEAVAQVNVPGYTRRDGTYVRPHQRTYPDGNPYNNYSSPRSSKPSSTYRGDPYHMGTPAPRPLGQY